MSGPVQVLLSTYNGAQYLEALLESIRKQDYPMVSVLIRDDGSSDETPDVLRRALPSLPASSVSFEDNLGPGQSFLELLRRADPAAAFVAFCDQDDVWLPDKLSVAVRMLDGYDGPAMYCSAILLADRSLRSVRAYANCRRGPSFGNALVENIATGCTMVLNRAAVDAIARQAPSEFLMHDAWTYLVVTALGGHVIYDQQPHVMYRLHPENSIGLAPGELQQWLRRLREHLRRGKQRPLRAQAVELRRLYGSDLPKVQRHALDAFLDSQTSLRRRVQYVLTGAAHRQRRVDDCVYRALYLIGRI